MFHPTDHVRISSILLEAGVVTSDQIDAALIRQRTTGLRIGETLVELGAATEEDIGWALARQLRLTFVDPQVDALDFELLKSFPQGLLQRLDAVPLVSEESGVTVALCDPLDSDSVQELEQACGRPLRLAVAAPSAIRRVLRDVFGTHPDGHTARPPLAPGPDFGRHWDRSGGGFLLLHLGNARRAQASEIHFLPQRGSLDVFHRIGSRLVHFGSEPTGALYYLLARLEDLGCPAFDERRGHAQCRIVCPLGAETLELSASFLRQNEGVSVVLDLRPIPARPPVLEDLGLDDLDVASLRGALDEGAGLGIVTGPPRSGGSTTLACLHREAAASERRSLAFGQPGASAHPSADDWREAIVAQNADVVALDGWLSGDQVTLALGPEAAGRLLLVRTDWTDTFALLEHLTGGPRERAALGDRLRFVVQQRVERIDDRPSESSPWAWPRADRRAVFEVLTATDSLRDALRAGAPAVDLRTCAERAGFQRKIHGS